jgi:hypothetical protein
MSALSLSLCMMSRKPAPQVRAILELFRPLVDEIVLAADRTGDPETLSQTADLADKRFAIDPAPLNRRLGWLHSHCECDWILRFDDDEVPSAALLASLDQLVSDRQPMGVALSRRWLYGSRQRWITTEPWSPDYQIRLVRNAPGAWRFPGRLHEPVEIVGDLRLVDLPIYHVELLLADAYARRAKREQYDGVRPGLVSADFPVNRFYTPEDHAGVETATTPPEDVELIAAVEHGAVRPEGASPRSAVADGSAWDAERFIASREVSPGAYRAAIELVRPPERLSAAVTREHEIVVTNLGDEPWPAGDYPPLFRLGYRWRTRTGATAFEGRCLFTERVRPGSSTRMLARIEPPPVSGAYLLELDVVHEHVRWFGCEAAYHILVEGAGPGTDGHAPRLFRSHRRQVAR